jgi:hypothetical protein
MARKKQKTPRKTNILPHTRQSLLPNQDLDPETGRFTQIGQAPLGKPISIRLPKPIEEEYRRQAEESGTSVASLLREKLSTLLIDKNQYKEMMGIQ